jgi:predicted SAM-dependent methyltransferase
MTLYQTSARLLDEYGVGPFLRPVARCLREQKECLRRVRYQVARPGKIRSYLSAHDCRKLHIGASNHTISGWINADLDPRSADVLYLDCTKPFPFANGTFDFAFCEHFIEHIDVRGAAICFSEVFRCLKPGGVFRLATPDLNQYVKLFAASHSPEQSRFLEQTQLVYGLSRINACLALNAVMYNWGHRFLYTSDELIEALGRAGFSLVRTAKVGESEHEALRGIEKHAHFYGDEMNRFETMVVEAAKPPQNRGGR